jgi:hypothetical protein
MMYNIKQRCENPIYVIQLHALRFCEMSRAQVSGALKGRVIKLWWKLASSFVNGVCLVRGKRFVTKTEIITSRR